MSALATTSAPKDPVNILLVDDQPAKLLGYETILEGLGEKLIRASSGKEALELLLRNEVAVVLVDVCMPELDGFELASMIRHHPRFQKTAIILVSGILVDDMDRLKGYDSGAVDYVSVPIIPEILRAKVAVFAELFRKNAELAQLNRELEQRVAERTTEITRLLRDAEQARREAERANRLKDDFLATLSHELRTPLNAITGWAHLLEAGGIDEATQRRAVETINRNARLQAKLISDILDVSRIITGKLRLEIAPVELASLVQATLDTVAPAAQAKAIQVRPQLECGNDTLLGDAARLQQVVWNLLSNAIKFAPRGGHVAVRLRRLEEERAFELTVEDDGPGIPPGVLPFIFDRFTQADTSSTRAYNGLGLGLAIVRHLTEMHGGSVRAANNDAGTGAVFRLTLPFQARPAEAAATPKVLRPAAASDGLLPAAAPSLMGLRILIVDDHADSREVASAVLDRCGAVTTAAASAAEGIACIEAGPPDVLVADIEMPHEDGYSLIRRVRALPPARGGTIPAIALTSHAGAHERRKALEAGFQVHVAKPIEPVELATAIARVVQSSSPDVR